MFENSSCIKRQEINKESEIQEVTNTLNTVFSWAIQKDFDLFYNVIANDADFRGVTPYKRVKFGFNEVKKDSAFWGDPKFKSYPARNEGRFIFIFQNQEPLHGFIVYWMILTNGTDYQQTGKM
ncbi:MAG: hypothetical protein MZV63_37955 [Marinilabiliales bacterium]|nr:hypothetical protein [Marinilabiliales bacterium]